MKLDKAVLGILLLALAPVAVQMLFGYGGHDFRQHVPSWMELRDLWHAGQWRPGWAPRANFTLGDPRFCYYPPVSFMVGAGLAMLLPFAAVPGAFVWLTFAASGLAMYFACREFVSAEDRWKAAVLYMFSPYLLTTSLVRFAAAEVLTLIWLPLIVLYFYRAAWLRSRRATMLLGCLLGLTWITNVPASIVLLYVLSFSACAIAVMQRSVRVLGVPFFAECIAGALAAFYLAPTWLEQAWIHRDAVLRDRFDQYFLFISPSQLPLKLFGIGLWTIALVSVGLAVFYAWQGWRDADLDGKEQRWTWLTVALVCFFFQVPLSAVLWRHLPELRFADFPYRFLAPVGVLVPLLLLSRGTPKRWRVPGYLLLGLLALVPLREYRAAKGALVDFKVVVPKWQEDGYRAWPEFVPAGATRPDEPMHFEPVGVADPAANPHCSVSLTGEYAGQKTLVTATDEPCRVRVAQYFFPYWRAVDDSGIPLPISKDAYGLLLISAPTGQHTIHLVFKASSPARTASLIASEICLPLVLLTVYIPRRVSFSRRPR